MITLSELQQKEVVFMSTGEKLGLIDDIEIDEDTGFVTDIIVTGRQMKGSFFQKPEETSIPWEQIVTIGTDIILVNEDIHRQIFTKEEKIEEGTDEEF